MIVGDKVLTVGRQVARLGEWFRLNQRQWGEELGLDRSTIASYKNVPGKGPSRERLKDIAATYGVPLNWFYEEEETDPPVPQDIDEAKRLAKAMVLEQSETISAVHPDALTKEESVMADATEVWLPTWDGVLAGKDEEWHFADDKPAERTKVPRLFLFGKNPKQFIVCNPKGYSMSPRITQGDKVIVRLEPSPDPNSIVIARRPDGVNFIKVYRVNRDGIPELHSINDRFPVIAPLEDWVCRGVVVAIWKHYMSDGPNVEINLGMPLRA